MKNYLQLLRLAFGALLLVFAGQVAHGQATCPGSPVTVGYYTPICPVVSTSGNTITVPNIVGAFNASFEEIPSGSPATVSVTIQGCFRAHTCDTAADTNTSTSATIREVAFSKLYTYFLITASWTGGTSATITVNPAISTARFGGGGGGGIPAPTGAGQTFVSTAAGAGNWTWGSASGITLQTNGGTNTSQTTLNIVNAAAFNGLTFTWTSGSGGQVTPALGGTLNAAGLTATGVGAGSCTSCNLTYNAQGQLLVAANGSGGGLTDPGSNGVVKRTALNTTAIAASTDIVALFAGCTGTQYLGADGNCHTASGAGTVTSISQTVPSWLNITGSPITSSGTLAITAATGQTSHQVIGTCGTATAFSPCSLVAADIPTLNQNTTGSAASFTGNLAGDVTGTQAATVVGAINGVSLSGLATGILKNTTTTGHPSIAVAVDFPTLNQNTTGSAASFSGSLAGDVTGTQSATSVVKVNGGAVPVSAPLLGSNGSSQPTSVTTIPTSTVPAFTGDMTNTAGSLATTVGKLNGAAVPASATVVGTNSSSQIVAQTGTITNNTSGTAANLSGTPALPNGTSCTTQTVGDNTTKCATDAFVLANSVSNPMTTLGDVIYGGASGAFTRLAGPTGPNGVPEVVVQTPLSGAATAEVWALPGLAGRAVTGTTDTILASDCSPSRVEYTSTSAVAITLPTATTLAVPACTFRVAYIPASGTASATITPTTWTINGSSTLALAVGQRATITPDPNSATNWQADVFESALAAGANITLTRTANGVSVAGSAGGVTSVGATVNSGSSSGIFAVTGSPVTGSGTLNINLSGTSGGGLYFSSSTVVSSTALLAAKHVLLGGGAATAFSSDSSLDDGGTTSNTLTYTASGGIASTTGPVTAGTAPTYTAGTSGGIVCTETTAGPTGLAAATDSLWCDSTDGTVHWLHVSTDEGALVGTTATQTITGKSIAASEVNSGTLAAAQMPALTGPVQTTAGSVATSLQFVTNAQTATYQVLAADFIGCKTIPIASGTFTVTLVAAGTQPPNGQCIWLVNYGTGVITIARSGQNLNGGTATLSLSAGSATAPTGAFIFSDGTNYEAQLFGVGGGSSGTVTSIATTSPLGGGTITTTGTLTCTTCTTNAAALTSTAIMTGGGGQASQTPEPRPRCLPAACSPGYLLQKTCLPDQRPNKQSPRPARGTKLPARAWRRRISPIPMFSRTLTPLRLQRGHSRLTRQEPVVPARYRCSSTSPSRLATSSTCTRAGRSRTAYSAAERSSLGLPIRVS